MSETTTLVVSREIDVLLTEKDLASLGEQASILSQAIKRKKEEWAIASKEHKASMRSMKKELYSIMDSIVAKKQKRVEEVFETKDFKKGKAIYVFRGKVVDQRDLTDEERQLEVLVEVDV